MFQILLIILMLFIAVPIVRLGYRIWRMQRHMRQFMEDPIGTAQREAERARRQADRQAPRQRRRSPGAASAGSGSRRQSTGNPIFDFFAGLGDFGRSEEPARKKKIPADVGEYVKFTEIKVTAPPREPVKFTREEQVEDIEWEDIK